MRNSSPRRYSYIGHDSRDSKFIHKNFNKTESYKTNFSEAIFENTAFIGAKFKYCAFYGASFKDCYIRGAVFKSANLEKCVFLNCIISSTIFEKCKVSGVIFEGCKILNARKINEIFPHSSFKNTEIFVNYPDVSEFCPELITVVEALRLNDFIRKSSVLHRKKNQVDTVSLKMLVDNFGEKFLLSTMMHLPALIEKDFHSLSYIMHFLRKLRDCDIKSLPGPVALGAPKT